MKEQTEDLTCIKEHHHCHTNWQSQGQPGCDIQQPFSYGIFSSVGISELVTTKNRTFSC